MWRQEVQLEHLKREHLTLLNAFVNMESPVAMVFEKEKEK